MNITKYQPLSCDALNITAQESHQNLQIFTPMVKEETVQYLNEEDTSQCNNEEGSLSKDYMCPYKPLESLNCVNYYDSQFCVLEEMKKEFPEEESLPPVPSISSRLVFENEESQKVVGTLDIEQEQEIQKQELSSIIKQEIDNKEDQFIVTTERLEEHRTLDNAGDICKNYDVLETSQEILCKLCGRTFKNSFSLLQHNNEHIKAIPPTAMENEMNELQKRQCYDKYFKNYDNMFAHDVHSNKHPKFKISHEGINLNRTGRNTEEIKYKCNSCERFYKSKGTLLLHIKRIHHDYGTMFKCWCGEQFRSPIHLSAHKFKHHSTSMKSENNDNFQCDYCQKNFKIKAYLVKHIKTIHYDYGKTFSCWCGKQFSTPIHLSQHKNRHRRANVRNANKPAYKTKFQCDICQKFVKRKRNLRAHMKNIHYDYSKLFVCWCGQRFRTLINLCTHKNRQHGPKVNNTINPAIKTLCQCDICKKFFKTKINLKVHIQSVHYDYGKRFECWCGKQFSTPIHLYRHKYRQHGPIVKNTMNPAIGTQLQCDFCQKIFKTKMYLRVHIKSIHYVYGKRFACWCGKQFSTPLHLYKHKYRQHGPIVKNTLNPEIQLKFQCDICQKIFNRKRYLIVHIQRIHYDYGKIFECSCGKQFPIPIHLTSHKIHHNVANAKKAKNTPLSIPM